MDKIILEGLRSQDLENLIYDRLEIDLHRSKMGEDKDVCVVAFTAKQRHPAVDLMEFIEKGYDFVLDADVSSGENDQGEYSIFVEIQRNPRLHLQISEMLYGIKKLTGNEDWKFKYHKSKEFIDLSESNLKQSIPSTPNDYEKFLEKIKVEEIGNFFNKTLYDNIDFENNIITINKPFNKKIKFELIKEDTKENLVENIDGQINIDEKTMGEIFWLTKIMGDYNIQKLGDELIFENDGKIMILKRIEQ